MSFFLEFWLIEQMGSVALAQSSVLVMTRLLWDQSLRSLLALSSLGQRMMSDLDGGIAALTLVLEFWCRGYDVGDGRG